MLRKNGFSVEQLRAVMTDYHTAGLDPAEVTMMDYTQKVTLHAYAVTQEDTDQLRAQGFSDAEILDITLAAAARCFFSKTLDALGAEPDEAYTELAEALRDLLPAGGTSGSDR